MQHAQFDPEFFPTPRDIARRMVAKISDDAKYFLEPSAGKGDLADVIRMPITYEEFEAENPREERGTGDAYRSYRWKDEGRRGITVDVIEQHPALSAVLRSKDYSVVGYDWLEYNGTSYYDACIMNPPFSCGDKHLLKAWDFLHSGEIVCLLNEETIKNPHTEDRKRLARVIEAAGGQVEYLGACFDTAERKSGVKVAMVYLKKIAPDDAADMWASEAKSRAEKNYDVEVGEDPNMLALRDNLGNMEHWYNMANEHWVRGIEHLRKAKLYMDQNKIHDYQRSGSHEEDFEKIAGMALGNVHTSRSEFLRRHRKLAWTSVFDQMEFNKWLDSKQQERFMRDVERDSTIPFTADNIKETLHNVFLSRKKLFDESVASIFDELCSHAVENGCGPEMPASLKANWRRGEGWKTNDSYKVNERLIFPYGCRYDDKPKGYNTFNMNYGPGAQLYSDLDRILCVLDGQPFDKCHTIGGALQLAFRRKHTCQSTQVAESEYFEIRFFKKGTVHLKWKRLDLLERFNVTAAAGKKWIGENTQQYRPTERKRKDYYCETNGCQYDDNRVCTRCETPEVDPLALITCEFCRAITEATGETHCPMHPLFIPVAAGNAALLLCEAAPEAPLAVDADEVSGIAAHAPEELETILAIAAAPVDEEEDEPRRLNNAEVSETIQASASGPAQYSLF